MIIFGTSRYSIGESQRCDILYLRGHCQAKQIIASEGYAGLFGRELSSADESIPSS